MHRILFLTYYFYPCNGTASNRPNSFVRNLNLNNFHVTVITRHWTGDERVWAEYLSSNDRPVKVDREKPNLEVHYLPFRAFRYPFISWLTTTWQNLTGNFNYELPFGQFYGYTHQLLSQHSFDYMNWAMRTVQKHGWVINSWVDCTAFAWAISFLAKACSVR